MVENNDLVQQNDLAHLLAMFLIFLFYFFVL